ncbi:hypothetical protein GALMADRAFT_235057 [Galerina marginata CBS 339.88]|uniref:Splicing arginine serine-rich 12 n=1 Tax=Galerina marginata (strain CBS 339.88) TaxID=685588 RepID=A0A067TRR2_GALM3|nr:hypothetical protein GALMADRAFT_235057 [Galerina marginata CBS 339.88]
MPSRRSHSRSRSRNRSESPERRVELPKGVSPISEADYFQKSDEFRLWLKEEKGKYFDGLSGDRARSYFRKFVKAWNRGKLADTYYDGIAPGSMLATTNTSYKWSFASKSRVDEDALRAARAEVGAATYGKDPKFSSSGHHTTASGSRPSGSGRVQGPAMPSAADLTLARELTKEQLDEERSYKRKRDKLEAKERIEDMVGPKPVGREGMLEKKRAKREGDRTFREKGDEGLELDESTLMGGGDSFRDQLARRDMSKKRYEQKNDEKQNAIRERSSAFREKEKATMDMFQQLAKQRFG